MKRFGVLAFPVLLSLLSAASAWSQWQCLYATWDDGDSNGTGHNTPNLAIIKQDMFVALVNTPGVRSFLIPYVNADSARGRVYSYGYGSATSGIYQNWYASALDQVRLQNPGAMVATPDSSIYVANNDELHNVLVFKYRNDSIRVVPPYPRTVAGITSIYGLAVDQNGYVYACNDTTVGDDYDVKVFRPANLWAPTHDELPVSTVNLPDGVYKGIAVSPNGQQLFIADYTNRRVRKYVGSPTTGYTLVPGFNFQLGPADTLPAYPAGTLPRRAKPIGLKYLSPNNILFVACDSMIGVSTAGLSTSYRYGRIYLVNPNTGTLVGSDPSLNTIDVARWNYIQLDSSYTNRVDGKIPGNASGYTSTYDVEFDQQGYLYSQSTFGWTVEKWRFNGTLPTIATVEEIPGVVPESYRLEQNYPNPFNPTTSIEFSILQPALVSIKVYNVLGQEIASLVNEHKRVGTYRVVFDARRLASGTYLYRMVAGGYAETRRMTIIK